ncbi:hypothetical protein L7F22_017511 [Adiantum nelumboides]|nr:hypothetical protein [Adiantum nelumboides]
MQYHGGAHSSYTLQYILRGHQNAISSVKFSPDGQRLGSSSLDKTVRIWNSSDRTCRSTLEGHAAGISDLAWSSYSLYICSASDDNTLRLWDVSTGDKLWTLKGHTNFVLSVNFNLESNLM